MPSTDSGLPDTGAAEVPPANVPFGLFVQGGSVKEAADPSSARLVRDYLGSMLQVHNLVILVGSGASFHLGSPQTRALSNEQVAKLIESSGDTVTQTDLGLLQAINPADNGDLEKLLNGLQLALSLADQAGQESVSLASAGGDNVFPRDLVNALRRKINRALAEACRLPRPGAQLNPPFDTDPYRAHRELFGKVLQSRRANLPRPKVFTTNYDLVIERSLDQLGYPYLDGFSGTVDRRLNLASYGFDFHRVQTSSQAVLARAEGVLYLHKVHGSLNWRATTELDRSTGIRSSDVVQVADGTLDGDLVLIYPTTAKEGDTLAYPYSDLLRIMGDAVQQDDTAILVIGYGFADAHINRLLLRSLATNPALNVLVADPFAVLESPLEGKPREDLGLTGKRLSQSGLSLRSTPIATLATGDDSRISILTGEFGKFSRLVELLPHSGLSATLPSPSFVATLIEALDGSGVASNLRSASIAQEKT